MSGVLHVITGLGVGGAETMLSQVAADLQNKGLPQHVVCLRASGPIADDLIKKHVPVTALNATSIFGAATCALKLTQLVNQLKPEVIQGWMYHGNLAAALAHRMSRGHAHRKLYWNVRASVMDADRYGRIIGSNAWLSRWPDLIVCNSQAGMDYHIKCGFSPYAKRVIPNGFNIEKFKPDPVARQEVRANLGIAPDAVVALLAARVDIMKDHPNFLEAIHGIPDVQGLLAGQDTEKLTLPPNVMALGLQRDISRLCAAADITICSSAFGEGFSNSLAEGMSAGLVPVATNVGDAAKIVADTGCIVAPRDPQALSDAIKSEASRPLLERRARGLRARQRIVENFSLDRIVRIYGEIYGHEDEN